MDYDKLESYICYIFGSWFLVTVAYYIAKLFVLAAIQKGVYHPPTERTTAFDKAGPYLACVAIVTFISFMALGIMDEMPAKASYTYGAALFVVMLIPSLFGVSAGFEARRKERRQIIVDAMIGCKSILEDLERKRLAKYSEWSVVNIDRRWMEDRTALWLAIQDYVEDLERAARSGSLQFMTSTLQDERVFVCEYISVVRGPHTIDERTDPSWRYRIAHLYARQWEAHRMIEHVLSLARERGIEGLENVPDNEMFAWEIRKANPKDSRLVQ